MSRPRLTFDEQVMKMYRCHIWIGRRDKDGYGRFRIHGRDVIASRYALERKLGRPILTGMLACHHCDQPPCVNPECLYEGTPKDNSRDMVTRGRQVFTPPPRAKPWKVVDGVEAEIVSARTRHALSQGDLAERFGLSQSYISKILIRNGIRTLNRRTKPRTTD